MAYIRSRSNLLTRRCHSSIAYILHHHRHDHDHHHHHHHDSTHKPPFSQHRSAFGTTTAFTRSSSLLGGSTSRCFHFSVSPTFQASFSRHMSTSIDEGMTDTIEMMTDAAELLPDTTVHSAVNEVALAAADSVFPLAQLQHFIDAVHSFTGFNWWASIVLATLLLEGRALLPLKLYHLKAYIRFKLITPRLKEIQQKIQDGGLHMYDGNKQIQMLYKEYNVTRFTPNRWAFKFIQAPVRLCLYFAVSNMVEKVPSFKTGGAYWFLDLSAPDSLYIFPVLSALTVFMHVELTGHQQLVRLKGNLSVGSTMKYICGDVSFWVAPATIGLPQAVNCFFLTSCLCDLGFSLAVRSAMVQKFLGLPEMVQRIRNQLNASKENEKRISTAHNGEENKEK
ncbi:inner membrane protein OXA1-like [Euphorbia peplus]|nr:inner membrane protein OXA1-like [Euphorbia peplus]